MIKGILWALALAVAGLVAVGSPPDEGCTCETENCFDLVTGGASVSISLGRKVFSFEVAGHEIAVGATLSFDVSLGVRRVFWHKCACSSCCPGTVDILAERLTEGEVTVEHKDVPPGVVPPGRRSYLTFPTWVVTRLEGDLKTGECKCSTLGNCYVEQFLTTERLGGSFSVSGSIAVGATSLSVTLTLPSQTLGFSCVGICKPDGGCSKKPAITDYPKTLYVPSSDAQKEFLLSVGFHDTDLPYDTHKAHAWGPTGEPLSASVHYDPKNPLRGIVTVRGKATPNWPEEGEIEVTVVDACENRASYFIRYQLVHPPTIVYLGKEGSFDGCELVRFAIVDPSRECADLFVHVRGEGGSASIGLLGDPFTQVNPSVGCGKSGTEEILVKFCPEGGKEERKIVVTVWNARYGLKSEAVVPLNVPPRARVDPPEVVVAPGKAVSAAVTAEDTDGDWITLTKVSGPGSFAAVEGRGEVSGIWSWTAPKSLRSYANYVSFVAKDPFGGAGYGFLLVRTVNPPQASDAHVVVFRGGKGNAHAYIHDPDSPWVSVSLGPVPPGLSVSAQVEDDPFAPGLGGFMVVFEVSAGPALCDGDYTVPFTVRDPDGGSSSATLYVRVVGNQPPVVDSVRLEGTVTVTLTPTGAELSPAVMNVKIADPDEDNVYVAGHDSPPIYAANLTLARGSLTVTYWPRLDDHCRVLREGDAVVDEFSVIVSDACGATTEIPCTVTIKVVDRTPPTITIPAQDLVVECDGQGNLREYSAWLENHGGAQADDPCTPSLSWSYEPGEFVTTCGRAGYREVVFIVRDAAGNPSTTSAKFIVVDTTPPVLSVPGDVTVECNAPTDPDHTGWATATDACDPNPQITYTDAVLPGACAQAKVILRTWRATDACGNYSTGIQRITVVDTTPPVWAQPMPGDMAVECHEVPLPPEVRATDNCDPDVTVTYSEVRTPGVCPYSYTLTRTWVATDDCGNSIQHVQTITVGDTTPPILGCPGSVYAETYDPSGTRVYFTVTASDNCDPSPVVSCTPPSGSWFPVGTTWVSCVATDACGNRSTCSFPVTVELANRPPVAQNDYASCDGIVFIPVLANDYDPDGDPLTIVSVSQPMCGTAWISGNGIEYTTMGWSCATPPGPGVHDSFTYTISDGRGGYATATVFVTITCTTCPLSLPPEEK